MQTKRIHAVKKRRQWFIKLTALLLVAGGLLFFAKQRKDLLVREGSNFLQGLLSRETHLDIKIGKISGRLSGVIRFKDVRVEDPALPVGLRLMLRAKEVEVRYRLTDLLTKNFGSKVEVVVQSPEVYWRPSVSLKRERFGFIGWARDVAMAKRDILRLFVRDLKVIYGLEGKSIAGIDFEYDNDVFAFALPLRHQPFWEQDVTTQLNVHGKFQPGLLKTPDAIVGKISTEATVVNWSPLPSESRFDFELSEEALVLRSSDFLGGMEVAGKVDFQQDDRIELNVKTSQYTLAAFAPFFKSAGKSPPEGHMDLDARLEGDGGEYRLEAYARIMGGRTGSNRFQWMDIHVSGVYPTLQLSDSRILMEDGSMMRFADKTVEFPELFSSELYHRLVSGEDQDTVVMGDWKFKRPEDETERPEFTMQRSFGKHASMHVTKFNEASEETLDSPEQRNTEVGFEYRLKGKDSLKVGLRGEDEKFVGVERKLSF